MMSKKEISMIILMTSISILLAMFFGETLLEYAGIMFVCYLLIGLGVALVGGLEWHIHNRKKGYRLETYKELFLVLVFCTLTRPIILSVYKK